MSSLPPAALDAGITLVRRPDEVDHVRVLGALGEGLVTAATAERIVDLLLASTLRLPARAAAVWLATDDGLTMVGLRHGDPEAEGGLWERLGQLDGSVLPPVAAVAQTARPVLIGSVAASALDTADEPLRTVAALAQLGSVALAPVTGRNGVVGVVAAGRGLLEQPMREPDLQSLRVQAILAGLAIDALPHPGQPHPSLPHPGLPHLGRRVPGAGLAEPAEAGGLSLAEALMDAFDSRAAVLDAAGRVVAVNARWAAAVEDCKGQNLCVCGPVPRGQSWLDSLGRAGTTEAAAFATATQKVLAGRVRRARLECRCAAAGSDRANAVDVVAIDGEAGAAVVVQADVSWRRRMQDELAHRALYDDLTGLPNRLSLREQLTASLARLDGTQQLAVLFCDLDSFKDINDGLGHAVGDKVLVAVARRLRQRCRSADIVARFGGDEFVVVLPVREVSRAVVMAQRLVEVLSEPIAVGDAEVAPGASIGIAVVDRVPPGDDPVGTLLRDADTAMYYAKQRGRGRFEFFDARLREHIEERLEMAAALRRAVPEEEFFLTFQARRRCGDRGIAGVEALLRWRHPQLGVVLPGVFVPIAERIGRIVDLGGWALREALAQVAALHERRLALAVNVSPRQLVSPGFVAMVSEALGAWDVEPARLTLEITESALVDDPESARAVLEDLRALGVTIALDDFGTGWSSLSYLLTLPVDILKIDRVFVSELPTDSDACAVVAAVLGLGHGMGLLVVAEGVEREDQLDVLRDMGCDEYQGFIDGEPVALDELVVRPGAPA